MGPRNHRQTSLYHYFATLALAQIFLREYRFISTLEVNVSDGVKRTILFAFWFSLSNDVMITTDNTLHVLYVTHTLTSPTTPATPHT